MRFKWHFAKLCKLGLNPFREKDGVFQWCSQSFQSPSLAWPLIQIKSFSQASHSVFKYLTNPNWIFFFGQLWKSLRKSNLIKGFSSVEGLLLPVDFNVFMASTFQARETAQLTAGSSAANKTIILFCFYSEYILRDIFQEKL